MEDSTLLGPTSSRAIRGMTSRPSFTEEDLQGSLPDDDLAAVAEMLHAEAAETDSILTNPGGRPLPVTSGLLQAGWSYVTEILKSWLGHLSAKLEKALIVSENRRCGF